jgi:hypothetical protein
MRDDLCASGFLQSFIALGVIIMRVSVYDVENPKIVIFGQVKQLPVLVGWIHDCCLSTFQIAYYI